MRRILELYAGIGGVAAAEVGEVVAAYDHNRLATSTYQANFDHPVQVKNLEFVKVLPEAELWWLSPPCQPYTVRGNQQDLADPRSRSFLNVLSRIAEQAPTWVGLENVPGFAGSAGHTKLLDVLADRHVWEGELCPTALGIPNVRRRFYLIAGPEPVQPVLEDVGRPLSTYLEDDVDPAFDVEPDLLDRFGDALHVVSRDSAETACFTSAYGNSPVYAGSYLQDGERLRRFTPTEIARLHHFADDFRFSDDLTLRQQYKLVGNSLNVAVVRSLLGAVLSASS